MTDFIAWLVFCAACYSHVRSPDVAKVGLALGFMAPCSRCSASGLAWAGHPCGACYGMRAEFVE